MRTAPLALALLISTTGLAQDASGQPTWGADLEAARQLAVSRGALIVAYVKDAAPPSPLRQKLEAEVLQTPDFVTWLHDHVPLTLEAGTPAARSILRSLELRDGMQLLMLDAKGRPLAQLEADDPIDLDGLRALAARAAALQAVQERSRQGDPLAKAEELRAWLDLGQIQPQVAYHVFAPIAPKLDEAQRTHTWETIFAACYWQAKLEIVASAPSPATRDEDLQRLALRTFRARMVPVAHRAEVLAGAADRALAIGDLAALDRILTDLEALAADTPSMRSRLETVRTRRDRLAAAPPISPAQRIETALPILRQLVREGITTQKPSNNLLTSRGVATVFDGSFDWHSCIAAHWAALSMARLDDDATLEHLVLDRLTPEVLECERTRMTQPLPIVPVAEGARQPARPPADPRLSFTPYVDAWTLMLLTELGRRPARDSAALRGFRAECVDRILTTLEQSPFPEFPATERRPQAAFCGTYRSWLFGYLALRLCGPFDERATARLATLARDVLEPRREQIATGASPSPYDFLDLRAVLGLVDRLEGRAAAPLDVAPLMLPDVVSLNDVHVLGARLSRLWPLGFDAASDSAAKATFEARAAELLARPDLWREDFTVVTHWIPQFLWLGIWLSRGRP